MYREQMQPLLIPVQQGTGRSAGRQGQQFVKISPANKNRIPPLPVKGRALLNLLHRTNRLTTVD
jgi:hypothetical protein